MAICFIGKKTEVGKRYYLWIRFVFPFAILCLAYISTFINADKFELNFITLVSFFVIYFIWIVFIGRWDRTVRRMVKKAIQYGAPGAKIGYVTLTIDENYFVQTRSDMEVKVKRIEQLGETDKHIFAFESKYVVYTIPKRAFETTNEIDQAVTMLRNLVK